MFLNTTERAQAWVDQQEGQTAPVIHILNLLEVIDALKAQVGCASVPVSDSERVTPERSEINNLQPALPRPSGATWEPSGKCQYDTCDGTRFTYHVDDDPRSGAYFCYKCGGMQIPPVPVPCDQEK